jgi:hypothetical protein
VSDAPLAGGDIADHLIEVADVLGPEGPEHVLVLVGGALLALHGLRESTRDVDSVRRLDDELTRAVAIVAERHELASKWLNSSAAAFLPETFDEAECEVILSHHRLRVLGAPFAQVFIMKLYASRAQDYDDMIELWPLTGFETPEQAENMFWIAYPHAPEDEYLLTLIRDIAYKATSERE